MQVDVEGFELLAVPSAFPLFAAQRVDNALVEFGPPKRWAGAEKSEADGLALLQRLATADWALEARLVQSYAWNDVIRQAVGDEALGAFLEALDSKSSQGTFLKMTDPTLWGALMRGESPSCCMATTFADCPGARRDERVLILRSAALARVPRDTASGPALSDFRSAAAMHPDGRRGLCWQAQKALLRPRPR